MIGKIFLKTLTSVVTANIYLALTIPMHFPCTISFHLYGVEAQCYLKEAVLSVSFMGPPKVTADPTSGPMVSTAASVT